MRLIPPSGNPRVDQGLSREIGRHGITLNSIKPGRITSEQMLRMHPTEEQRREFTREIPVQRFGEPDELADLAVFWPRRAPAISRARQYQSMAA